MPILSRGQSLSGSFGINRASPHAELLRLWFPSFAYGTEFMSNTTPTFFGGSTVEYHEQLHQVLDFDGGSTTNLVYDDNDRYTFTDAFSIAFWVRRDTTSGNSGVLGKYDSIGASEYTVGFVGSNLWWLCLDNDLEGFRGRTANYASFSGDGLYHHVVCTYNGGVATSSFVIYIDGVKSDNGDLSSGSYTSLRNTTSAFRLGRAPRLTSNSLTGALSDVRFYDKEMSLAEVVQMYHNPFELYAPSLPMFVVAPAVGGGNSYELSSSIASLSSTPNDVEIAIARSLTSSIGSLSTTPDGVSVAVAISASSVITSQSTTPDASISITRSIVSVISSLSTTPDNVTLDIAGLIELSSVIVSTSTTPDSSALSVARALGSVISSLSSTPNDAALNVQLPFASGISSLSTTPGTSALVIARELQAAINSLATAPNDAELLASGLIELSSAIASQSVTPNDASIIASILIASAITSQSTTPDTSTLTAAQIVGLITITFAAKAPKVTFTN